MTCAGCFTSRIETWYPLYSRLGGHQAGLENVQKIPLPPEFNPQTVQPRARHYTDYANSTEHKMCV